MVAGPDGVYSVLGNRSGQVDVEQCSTGGGVAITISVVNNQLLNGAAVGGGRRNAKLGRHFLSQVAGVKPATSIAECGGERLSLIHI